MSIACCVLGAHTSNICRVVTKYVKKVVLHCAVSCSFMSCFNCPLLGDTAQYHQMQMQSISGKRSQHLLALCTRQNPFFCRFLSKLSDAIDWKFRYQVRGYTIQRLEKGRSTVRVHSARAKARLQAAAVSPNNLTRHHTVFK